MRLDLTMGICSGGVKYCLHKIKCGICQRRPDNSHLIRIFSDSLKGVQLSWISECASRCRAFMDPGAVSVLEYLSQRLSTGIISQSVAPVIAGIRERLPPLEFAIAAPVNTDDSGRLFEGYEKPVDNSGAKADMLKRFMEKHDLSRPLIFGHCRDELPLVELAESKRGVSVGILPDLAVAGRFDIVSREKGWKEIHRLLLSAFA